MIRQTVLKLLQNRGDLKNNSLRNVAAHLATLVKTSVFFINETRGVVLETAINNKLGDGIGIGTDSVTGTASA